jgi:hypothetical protein
MNANALVYCVVSSACSLTRETLELPVARVVTQRFAHRSPLVGNYLALRPLLDSLKEEVEGIDNNFKVRRGWGRWDYYPSQLWEPHSPGSAPGDFNVRLIVFVSEMCYLHIELWIENVTPRRMRT